MKPANFKEMTIELQKPKGMNDECGSLPIWTDGNECLSCWKPTLRERLSILLFGKVWVWVLSGKTQPPITIEDKRDVFA